MSDQARIEEIALCGIEDEYDARFIASLWHGGQFTAAYAYSSSGYADRALLEIEFERAVREAENGISREDKECLDGLLAYIAKHYEYEAE